VPEADLAAWVERHGRRKLSRRSHAFWQAVLDVQYDPADSDNTQGTDLWPL